MHLQDEYDYPSFDASASQATWYGNKITINADDLVRVVIHANDNDTYTGCRLYEAQQAGPALLATGTIAGQVGTIDYSFVNGTSYYVVFTKSSSTTLYYKSGITTWPFTSDGGDFTMDIRADSVDSGANFSELNNTNNAGIERIEVYGSVSLELTFPNGGESLVEGREEDITWTDSGSVANVKLEFSDDNGGSWSDIVASTTNDGSYDWTVPVGTTVQGLVRVTDVLDAANTDESDAVFSVISPPDFGSSGGGRVVQSWLNLTPFKDIISGKIRELGNRLLADWGLLSPVRQINGDFRARVIKVHDGDTVTLQTSWREKSFPLRLADIDALELNEGGHEARDWLKKRILNKNVIVHVDSKNRVGKYGRLIGEVYHRGFNVAEEMRNKGLVAKFGEKDMFKIPSMSNIFSKHRVRL